MASNKGHNSGNAGGQFKTQRLYLDINLYRQVGANPKVEVKRDKPRAIPVPHLSDEDAVAMIRAVKAGMTHEAAAEKYGVKLGTARRIINGTNRPHLLRMVEEGQTQATYFRFRRRGGRGYVK